MSDDLLYRLISVGTALRNAGMKRVASANADWLEYMLNLIEKQIPVGTEIMGEEFQYLPGGKQPTHSNAWGALTFQALKRGLIEDTGKKPRKGTRPRNHAHKYAVYRRIKPV